MNEISELRAVIAALSSAVERLYHRVMMIFCNGAIQTVDDSGPVRMLQVKFGPETNDGLQQVQEYGFTSVPLPGCAAVALFIGGDRSNGAVVGTNDARHRLAGLQPGEVAIYDDLGQMVKLTRTGIRIYSPLAIRTDVHGYASETRWNSGTSWTITNWTTGATVATVNLPIAPPETP